MSNTLYLECYAGISGDMMVAALLDLGASRDVLEKALSEVPVKGFQINIRRVKKAGIDACDFDVILDETHENHDHDMKYLYGHDEHVHEVHIHEEHINEEHIHEESQDVAQTVPHHHEHRNLKDILHIIEHSSISARAQHTAARIFTIIAEAEAKAHGTDIEHVHFHEVGAVDSIVDIIAVSVCLDNLDITDVIISDLYEGKGTIRCQHGILPIPVPAVAAIAASHHLRLHLTDVEGELVTPTGAAIAAAIRTGEHLPESFEVKRIGVGAGKRAYKNPSMLRAMLICRQKEEQDTICKLESNIDDSTGETLGYTMERLFEAGAKDVYYTPIFMKKNRPAYQLSVICRPVDTERLERIIFEETTTIGIRRVEMERTILEREVVQFETSLGMARIKRCTLSSGLRCYPEYESVARLSIQHDIPYMEAYRIIQGEYEDHE